MKIYLRFEPANDILAPSYQTQGASGFDISADVNDPWIIAPGRQVLIPTGIYLAVPEGYELQVRPRSGLAAKNEISITNSPGTVDADYRGEVKVMLRNNGRKDFVVNRGDRIAQGVICPVIRADFVNVEELSSTDRGEGGFGSTGVAQ